MKKNRTGSRIRIWLLAVMASALLAGTALAGEMNPSGFEDDDYPGEHVSTDVEGGISRIAWSGDYAVWETYGKVSKYEVTLYRDDEKIVKKYVVSQKRINMAPYMVGSGDYVFTVRAEIGWGWTKTYKSKPRNSMDELYSQQIKAENNNTKTTKTETTKTETSAATAEGGTANTEAAGGWVQAEDGTGRWWYRNGDASYPKSEWKTIDEKQYYFDEEGWMVTGTREIDGVAYQFDESGAYIAEN